MSPVPILPPLSVACIWKPRLSNLYRKGNVLKNCVKKKRKNATWLYYFNKAYTQCKISCVSFVPILRERKLSYFCFPKVILSPSFCMCDWLPTDLDRKTFTFYKLNLNPWTHFFLKKRKVTCCHLPILLLKLKWYTHLCKGCGMLFREITLALISPWYTVNWLGTGWRWLALLLRSFTSSLCSFS